MAKKTCLGRQKIKIAKIKNPNHLQVTFSKRRSGLFKKASELCTLCGVEIAVVVFSPAQKAFSFGHPNVEALADRFLRADVSGCGNTPREDVSVRDLNAQLMRVNEMVEEEKERVSAWRVEKLGMRELEKLAEELEELEELRRNAALQADLMSETTSSLSFESKPMVEELMKWI